MEFEKLGSFYLGKEYDLKEGKILDRLLMYDARDLTTHAVCVGMTGSGKTGLCIDLLEEAAIDQVPAIIIDPKGDMTNLLLGFPDLEAKDFRPWVNVDDARRKGLNLDEFAGQQAALWSKGLKQWGQDGSRINLLKNSAEYVIYTPGSGAGVPVSILESFKAPSLDWDIDAEVIRERIQGIVAGLLGLIGVDADPVRSRESILLASLFEHYWRAGEDLDIARIILAIQKPPLSKLGVFDVETFFPEKDRFELAMGLNNIIASPAFQSWTEGQPMDVGSFLATDSGKPKHSIFYIAHLSESERMFFVTMLLNQIVTWVRTQPGTTSLRAILYMDEIFGYFPPVAEPPSKKPMLTLLKQARAYGLGVVLATQNPIDLDYKGLTNTGTWFIGRLQTERDKARVLDGLEGISGQGGTSLDRATISKTISDLDKRVFLLHNVHEEAPQIFQTRWAMNYLRGPMTRSQIKQIQGKSSVSEKSAVADAAVAPVVAVPESPYSSDPPPLPPDIGTVFLPVLRDSERAAREVQARNPIATESSEAVIYVPNLVGMARVHFVNRKLQVNEVAQVALLVDPPSSSAGVDWEQGRTLELLPRDLMSRPYSESRFMDVPESINQARELKAIEKDFSDYLYRSQRLILLHNKALEATSNPSESKRDFLMRLNLLSRERRDAEVDSLNRRYEKKLQRLEERLKRAHITLEKKEDVASSRKREAYFSIGESILGVFLGRRATRAASSGMSKYRMSSTAKMAAREAAQDVESMEKEIQELQDELTTEVALITDQWDESVDDLQDKPVAPRRVDIDIELLSVAWVPHWEITYKNSAGLSRSELIAAI